MIEAARSDVPPALAVCRKSLAIADALASSPPARNRVHPPLLVSADESSPGRRSATPADVGSFLPKGQHHRRAGGGSSQTSRNGWWRSPRRRHRTSRAITMSPTPVFALPSVALRLPRDEQSVAPLGPSALPIGPPSRCLCTVPRASPPCRVPRCAPFQIQQLPRGSASGPCRPASWLLFLPAI
jgi:hypothetical protein